MQVVYHLGAHCTDEHRLLKCLLKNKGKLSKQGIVVPGPSRFRAVLRETLHQLRGGPAPPEMQETLLDAIMDEDHAERLVFSRQAFLASTEAVLDMNLLYSQAGESTAALANLFPQAQTEFFLGIRNPATFIPALFASTDETDFTAFVAGITPRTLRWSETVARIRSANPNAKITVWCNEDTPLLWSELLQALSGHDPDTELVGTYDFVGSIMAPGGLKRMRDYLEAHPPLNETHRRRVLAAFLDKYALDEEVEIELDLPGWNEDLIEEMTETYEEDVFEIERIPGVTVIAP